MLDTYVTCVGVGEIRGCIAHARDRTFSDILRLSLYGLRLCHACHVERARVRVVSCRRWFIGKSIARKMRDRLEAIGEAKDRENRSYILVAQEIRMRVFPLGELEAKGIASETWGRVSATRFRNTVSDSKMVTPETVVAHLCSMICSRSSYPFASGVDSHVVTPACSRWRTRSSIDTVARPSLPSRGWNGGHTTSVSRTIRASMTRGRMEFRFSELRRGYIHRFACFGRFYYWHRAGTLIPGKLYSIVRERANAPCVPPHRNDLVERVATLRFSPLSFN
ncbi:hypothetical protein X777_02128 [Ooceraea biroi]|uniref:Uncharacterized protein n=1 Tax=Ooceraea biroi TaxID=2015173 RepID=A0A026WNP4_OOCBI|nr:hypothetical protein X777_02128 [Ooceraea biroi]